METDPIDELLQRLLSVDGVYCPDCDKIIKFEETVTTSMDRKLDCCSCVGECAHCHCALAQIYCFISRKVPWMMSVHPLTDDAERTAPLGEQGRMQ